MANVVKEDAAPAPAVSAPVSRIRQPAVWLLVILGLGLVLRWLQLDNTLQQDEFGPLYAVAERPAASPNATPTVDDPLQPVSGWAEVRERSVLPYGIVQPVPLYHWLLYAVVKVLPIAEWSLRLPSLLAGLGCIVAVYFLCRRLLGTEAALVAALLAAVDPMQVAVSALVRPYALANLACVASFLGFLGILYSRTTAGRVPPRCSTA
jgi:4-amino-4-deoxy-L-arabinose transferase-like glycosyltransferase